MEAPFSEPFFTRRMKMLSRADGFMLYGKMGVDFFSTCELLYRNLKTRLRLMRARHKFHMIRDNPNVIHGIVYSSLYTSLIALKDEYHTKNGHACLYSCAVQLYGDSSKKFLSRHKQFIQKNIFNNAPVRQFAIAMNTNSAFTGS